MILASTSEWLEVSVCNGGFEKEESFVKKVIALSVSAMMVLSLCACSFSFSTANIQDLATASEIDENTLKPVEKASTFSPSTPKIYLTGSLNNAPDDTMIKAKWIYLEDDPAVEIDSATYEAKDSDSDFQFSLSMPDDGWPVGKYQVRLYINDKIKEAVKFDVAADAETSASATSAAPATSVTEPSYAYLQDLETGGDLDSDTYKVITPTGIFAADTPTIYVSGSLMSAKYGDELTAYWQYTEDYPAVDLHNSKISIEHVDTDFYFSLQIPDGGWDAGDYEIQFYINGVYDTTVDFYVE